MTADSDFIPPLPVLQKVIPQVPDIAEPTIRYRVGRKLGRTIYLQFNKEPSDDDRFIGIMDKESDAQWFVDLANEKLA